MEHKYAESNLFQLKNGQYLINPEQSRVFSTIINEQPHYSLDYKWDEMSMGTLFAKCYHHNTIYCPEMKQWYIYDGSRWIKDVGALTTSDRLKEFTRLMLLYCNEIDDEAVAKDYKKFVSKLGDRRVRDRIMRDAQSDAAVSIEQFDSDPYLINLENGTYDLRKQKFYFHRAEDYLTMKANCYYILPTMVVRFDRWDKFISEIMMGDKKMMDYLQRALGYSILGVAKEECMFFAHGKTTRNGKGTLLNTIMKVLGDYASSIDTSFITRSGTQRNYNQADPMLAALKSVRFLVMSESDEQSKLDEQAIKNYTGRDPITTRQLYGDAFTFTPQFTMWLSCNTLPDVHDKSLFSSDRIKIIEFNKHFSKAERDTTLKEQFSTDDARATIFMWLLEGYKKYVKRGLADEPESVQHAVENYERSNDTERIFVEEMCEIDAHSKTSRTEIYNAYRRWCKNNGVYFKSAMKFYDDLDAYAERITVRGQRMFKGIKLRNNSNVKIK